MDLVCPKCRTPLRHRSDNQRNAAPSSDSSQIPPWECESCRARYPVRHGIPCFLEEKDDFYEGRFPGTHFIPRPETRLGRLLFRPRLAWSLDMRYLNLLRRFLTPERGGILDLGCGGGHEEISAHGAREVVGLDLSLHSLRCASAVYSHVVQASAARMPFADGYFDAVVSSNFLGHVPMVEKDAVYAEMTRVLRDGGIMLHQLETSSDGALFRWARRNPDFYRERLVELDGHVGLELPSEALERFHRFGLKKIWSRTEFVWYFLPQGEPLKRFDTPYARENRILRWLLRLDRFLQDKPRGQKLADLVFGLANDAATWFTPLDRTIGLCVALKKIARRKDEPAPEQPK